MDILVGRSARVGDPTRPQYWRRHLSGRIQALTGRHAARWMRSAHVVRVRGLTVEVPVGVFPPRFFHSTRLLCDTLARRSLAGVRVLEVGCGSGAVSLTAASRGAAVVAVDLSQAAVAATSANAARNGLTIDVRHSDLFTAVPERFDLIVVNPPYFRHDPETELDHAFHAGAGFEYFHRLFAEVGSHVAPDGRVLVTLAEGCDGEVASIAAAHGWGFRVVGRRFASLQWTYLLQLEPLGTTPSVAG